MFPFAFIYDTDEKWTLLFYGSHEGSYINDSIWFSIFFSFFFVRQRLPSMICRFLWTFCVSVRNVLWFLNLFVFLWLIFEKMQRKKSFKSFKEYGKNTKFQKKGDLWTVRFLVRQSHKILNDFMCFIGFFIHFFWFVWLFLGNSRYVSELVLTRVKRKTNYKQHYNICRLKQFTFS